MGTRSYADVPPTAATIALNAYIFGFGGHSLVTPHATLKHLWWTDHRIQAKITRPFVISKLRGEEREFLDKQLAFGEGLTDDTYMEWILDRAKRLFLILAEIGVPDQIFGCIDDSWDDDDLPVSMENVKNLELAYDNDDELNKKFYETQFVYLLRELRMGAHIDYGPNEHIPMDHVNTLPPAVSLQVWDRISFPGRPDSIFMRRKYALTDKETGQSFRQSFMQDIRQANALRHEHIANVWASYTSEDAGYILSDFVGEHTLSTFIDHRTPMQFMRIPVAQRPALLLEWIHCLSDALASLHYRGTAHAAIRPSNILIDHDNHIAFADVGALRTFQRGKKPQKTETYDYAAPESQVSKAPIVVPSSPPVSSISAFNRLRKMSSSTSGSSTDPSTGSSTRSNSLCHTAPTSPATSPRSMAKARSNSFTTTISAAFSSSPLPTHSSSSLRNFSRHMLSNEPCPYPSVPTSPRTIQSQMSMPRVCSALPNPDSLQDLPEAAPEMSDIYSLACVFLDILTFLLRGKLNDFVRFRGSRIATSPSDRTKGKVRLDHSFHCNPEKVEAWIDTLREESERRSEEVFRGMPDLLRLIQRMMAQNALLRPSAIVSFVDAASLAPTHVLRNVIPDLSLFLAVDNRMRLPQYEQAEAAKLTSVHTSSPATRHSGATHSATHGTPEWLPASAVPDPEHLEGARQGFGQHQAAFQHTPQMQPFQQPNMHQQPHVMHDPSAMPMAMTGPGINWPGPMHPQQTIHQQPPRGFTPIYGPMQPMPMGVVGPNVEYNQTPPPLMPPQYQQMHAPSQADRQYRLWHAMPVEDGFANNPARLVQRQAGMQVNQMPPPGWVPPYPPHPVVFPQAPWIRGPAAQVPPWSQQFQPVPHQQHQPQPVVPNQHHVVPRPEDVPPWRSGSLPHPGHRHSHPGALLSHHHYPVPDMHAPWTQMPVPKLKDFGPPSPAAYALHQLNPAVPIAHVCRFVSMYHDRFAKKFELNMLSGWCQKFERSSLTPQQLFDNVDEILTLNEAWDLKEMLSLLTPAVPNAVRYPVFLQLSNDGGNYQGGNDQHVNGQGVHNQVANAQGADDQSANPRTAKAQDASTQTVDTQAADDQGANASISLQPENNRTIVHAGEAESSNAIEATRRRTEAPEHIEGQETQQHKLVVKLKVGFPGSTASPRGRKRTSQHDNDEHESVEATDTPNSDAVDKPRMKKNKTESPVSDLKASDLKTSESPDPTMQDEIDFTDTSHLSSSVASQDSDSPTPRRSKQPRPKGTKKKAAVAHARRHVKLANMPADQVPHVGPVFPSRRAILARDSRPYIHSICGRGFKHVDDVKSHHFGNASKMVGCPVIRAVVATDGRKAIAKFPAWDTHESCKVGYTDIQCTQTKDGYVFLNQESWDKVQSAVNAGEEYKRMMNEGGDGDDDVAIQDQDDVVTEVDEDLVNEDVNEESQDDDTKNIDPFLLSSEAELGWKYPTQVYAPQPIDNYAPASNTPEQMSKRPMKAESPVDGMTLLQRAAMAIPLMDKPPAHFDYTANTSLYGANPMGQPANYHMPSVTQPNPAQQPTTTPTKPGVPKRKVVKAGWNEQDEHDEEKLRAAALELKNRRK
ncbi:kinase-like protein [Hortaea werneckii]|nr:kinase-like protein [Hortaea werneckii]KAI7313334.1 kinase-like protein [Hortaea werneckii]